MVDSIVVTSSRGAREGRDAAVAVEINRAEAGSRPRMVVYRMRQQEITSEIRLNKRKGFQIVKDRISRERKEIDRYGRIEL